MRGSNALFEPDSVTAEPTHQPRRICEVCAVVDA
jgi:hypothetical protein